MASDLEKAFWEVRNGALEHAAVICDEIKDLHGLGPDPYDGGFCSGADMCAIKIRDEKVQ